MEAMEFKSPLRKLVSVFRRSRDRWKRKYAAIQASYRNLSKESARVARSRTHWRETTYELRQRIKVLERELAELKR